MLAISACASLIEASGGDVLSESSDEAWPSRVLPYKICSNVLLDWSGR
jgi:hypothetical protein